MKYLSALFLFVLIVAGGYAQNDKDSSIKKAAASICNCLEKNHMEAAKDQTEMQAIFLQCMLDSASFVMSEIFNNAENGDYQKASEEVAQKIAIQLVNSGCKPFIQMSMKMSQGAEVPSVGDNEKETASVKTVDGTVTGVEEKDFLYITVKTTAGREITVIYMDYVDHSDDWLKDPVNKLKNKNVTVQYTEEEVYQPKLKDFRTIKKLRDLKIKKS